MRGDRKELSRICAAAEPDAGRRLPAVLMARLFAPSPYSLAAVAAPVVYPLLGGPAELYLPLVLVGLLGCLFLTMLELGGLLLAVNLIHIAGGWWLSDSDIRIEALAGLLMLDTLILAVRYAVFSRLHALSEANACLAQLAMVDHLTGAYNRQYLDREGERIHQGFLRGAPPFSVILMDVDDFKDINDTHGHAGGDMALTWLARLLHDVIRAQDVAGRYGGDELLIILPGTRLNEALETANRLQGSIARKHDGIPASCRHLYVSMGLAQVETTDSRFSDVVKHADTALYTAKHTGRDAIRLWRSDVPERMICGI